MNRVAPPNYAPPKFSIVLPRREVTSAVVVARSLQRDSATPPTPSSFAATHIVNGIFLGTWTDAECEAELRARGIRRVVDIAPECRRHERSAAVATLRLDVVDHSDAPIAAHLREALDFMRAALVDEHGAVLVHCRQGVSRSATVVIAYLMAHGVPPAWAPAATGSPAPPGSPLTPPSLTPSSFVSSFRNPFDGDNFSVVCSDGLPSPPLPTPRLPQPGLTMSYQDAFDYVKHRRPWISPNLGFTMVLHRLDTSLRRGCRPRLIALEAPMEECITTL